MLVSTKKTFHKTGCHWYKNVAYPCSDEHSFYVLNDECVQSTILSGLLNVVFATAPATSDYNELPLHCDKGLFSKISNKFQVRVWSDIAVSSRYVLRKCVQMRDTVLNFLTIYLARISVVLTVDSYVYVFYTM
jgi:hypothetical protein